MSQRFEGRNLEDALQQAAQTLGVERWQLTYHVLLEKRGFLGGMKRVVLEAEVNTAAAAPPVQQAAAPMADPHPPRAERGPRGGGGGGGRGRGGDRGGRGRGDRGGRRDDRGPRPHRGRELRTGDFETFLGDVPEQGPEIGRASCRERV